MIEGQQMSHTILTFVTPVQGHKVDELRSLLNEIGKDIKGNRLIPFPSMRLLHFASLWLTEGPGEGEFAPLFVFESNFDGPLDAYLDELFDRAGASLHLLYGCCIGYPARSAADRDQLKAYLRAHIVRPNACYVGTAGRTLERVKQESALTDSLQGCLDDVVRKGFAGTAPESIREKLQAFVRTQPELRWALRAPRRLASAQVVLPWLRMIAAGLLLLVFLPVLLPGLLVGLIVLRYKETHDPPPPTEDKNHTKELVEREDRTHIVQNHMAHLTVVKPGTFRLLTLRAVLWLANLVAGVSNRGALLGIPSIHFAHWSLIDNGKRLLFVSNFDGSWENYLDDFIDKGSFGLTAIWSNTVGFPRTRFLFFDGARDGARFKAFARDWQRYTNAWYSAYPDLTVQTIDNNSNIRDDLFSPLHHAAIRAWLWRF
jgi:hypothetical protein